MRDELEDYYAALEVQEFKRTRPEGWIFYIDLANRIATNYRGSTLGRVILGKEVRWCGLAMNEIFVLAINGCKYKGLYSSLTRDHSLHMELIEIKPIGANIVLFAQPTQKLKCPILS